MDSLIHYGGEVKALGDGKFRAPLVVFGREAKDLDDDFFTPQTDLWQDFPAKVPLLYAHGLDPQMKHKRLGDGKATLTRDDAGVWMEGQLDIADAYEKKVYEMIERGRMGTSSGAVAHLVSRRAEGKAYELTSWPIAEASLTPKPCNPLNRVQAVKDFAGLAIPEFKDVMTAADGFPPANPRNDAGTAYKCPVCHLYFHHDADHKQCPYCGFRISDSDLAPAAKSFADELDSVLAAVESCKTRACDIHSIRVKEGRSLSQANRDKLQAMHSALSDLLTATEPKVEPADVDALALEILTIEAGHALSLSGV